ncbi:hypothetical protein [Cytobacillus pseudoceanisediminis]|uniref:hypothetical protein n=1 Tax=Cytobacillus pseudoceanisediminis TaxID=3051614 RepID=UPI0001F44ACE|nr:hypothetical protein HMPREF1013_04808 [Bacillus sp. 2_A_57_CT2]
MTISILEDRKTAALIRQMTDILEFYGYMNVKYESSDCHAHYFHYESIEDNGDIEKWDLQVELEGDHDINHRPVNREDWYYVGETFQELMECSQVYLNIAI